MIWKHSFPSEVIEIKPSYNFQIEEREFYVVPKTEIKSRTADSDLAVELQNSSLIEKSDYGFIS